MYYRYNDDNKVYKIGLYIRLSREDGDDLESESISNQRSLLIGYLKANNLKAIDEYIDDGFSGGNFNRPGFRRLINDVESGKINCIITKDLSRLGRDHIDTGNYIERYFPENNIRYIAVNDDIDTFNETSASDMMPFKLSMNDMYAKDISKKVRSSLLTMKQQGKFCGSVPSYGYKRNPNNKYQLIVDKNTASIVRKIFDMYVTGYRMCQIADILTREGIPTPVMIKNKLISLRKADHPEIWKTASVNNILRNRVYTGCLVQHTTQNITYKTKKRKVVPKNDWCIFENAHESIIDKKTFELVQSIRNNSNNYSPTRRKVDYVLSGLVYCKDCGSKMSISFDKKRNRVSMNCNTYRKFSKYNYCFSHYINYDKLEKTLYNKISELTSYYLTDKQDFKKIIEEKYIDPKNELNKKYEQTQIDIHNIQLKQDLLYDDKFNDIINVETYRRLFEKYEIEINNLKLKSNKYEVQLKNIKTENVEFVDYIKIIEQFLTIKNPTKEMINKLIKKINITKESKVEIYYRFGNIENREKLFQK